MHAARSEPLTLERWRTLPWLLPRATVMEWTGMSRKELDSAVASGLLSKHRGRRKGKFYKVEVAALIRLPTADRTT